MRVIVIGSGYVGLVAAACFANDGHTVVCVDKDEERVARLRNGECPIYEEGLPAMLGNDKLVFTSALQPMVAALVPDVFIVAVGTPSSPDGSCDMSYVDAAVAEINVYVMEGTVVIKSTVPPGTGDRLSKLYPNLTFVSNPEFLREGSGVRDFENPDRIVIGAASKEAAVQVAKLYTYRLRSKVILMDIVSAELAKYASNAMLATRVSFMNELSLLAEAVGGNIDHVREVVGSDSRIGRHFLKAGPGYGGSCFPKDIDSLIHIGDKYDMSMDLLRSVRRVNENRLSYMLDKVRTEVPEGSTIAVWGVAFKDGTDDIRHSQSVDLIKCLDALGYSILHHDAIADTSSLPGTAMNTPTDTRDATALIVMADSHLYRMGPMGLDNIECLIDFRNIYAGSTVPSRMKYIGVGKPQGQT